MTEEFDKIYDELQLIWFTLCSAELICHENEVRNRIKKAMNRIDDLMVLIRARGLIE